MHDPDQRLFPGDGLPGLPLRLASDSPARSRIALVLLALLGSACDSRSEGTELRVSQESDRVADMIQDGSVASSFYGGDPGRLRAEGQPERVLVRSGDSAFITAGQYNAWLGTYPLHITSEDPSEARRQALEQMVTFKLIAQKAREVGYEERLGSGGASVDDRSLALGYIRNWVTNVSSVTDAEARAYASREQAGFAQLDSPDIPGPMKIMAIQGSVRGEQLWTQVQAWMEEARIRYESGPS